MIDIKYLTLEEIKDNGQLSPKLAQELKRQPYYDGKSIEAYSIDFLEHAKFFLKLFVGTQLKFQLELDDLYTLRMIQMELPDTLIPFILDFNRHYPILKYNGLFFNSVITKYFELVMVPVKEESIEDRLVLDINP